MWLYEHTTKFHEDNQKKVPRICSWPNLYQGKKYDAGVLLCSLKEKEVSDVAM